ncbi:MAG: HD domain-containing protein [Caldilineaceae bacterium]|jgi:putative hydrolase of HD superfamily
MIALLERVLRLKRLPRTGWLLAGISLPESVADHSFSTALLASVLAEQVNAEQVSAAAEADAPVRLDVGRVVRMALVHDLAESMITDLPKEATSYIGAGRKHIAERDAMVAMLKDVPGGEQMMVLWQEYAASETAEAKLVRDADKLEMVLQARHYASAGNTNLADFWTGHDWSYAISRDLYQSLNQERLES